MLSVQLGLLPDECPSTSPRGVAVTFSTLASEERELRLVAIVTDDSTHSEFVHSSELNLLNLF